MSVFNLRNKLTPSNMAKSDFVSEFGHGDHTPRKLNKNDEIFSINSGPDMLLKTHHLEPRKTGDFALEKSKTPTAPLSQRNKGRKQPNLA